MTKPAPEGTGSANLPVQAPILDPESAWRQRVARRARGIISRADVEHALAAIPRVQRSGLGLPYGGRQTLASPRTYERERWYLSVSPGTVRVHRKLVAPKEKLWDDDAMSDGGTRGAITEFSAESRARMFRTLPALDYTPMFASGAPTAMVTLTLPGRHWEELVPDMGTMAEMRAKFQRAYLRAWGAMPIGVWKLEFQRRGAPHLHLFMAPPTGRAGRRGTGARFQDWLGQAWAAIVDPSKGTRFDDVEAYQDHAMYGTRVDWNEGRRFSDPKRIAAYFSKHGVFAAKEYQNDIPEHWRAAILENGKGGARFWGYWQLEKAEVTVELAPRRGASRRAAFMTEDGPVRYRTEPVRRGGWADEPGEREVTGLMSVSPVAPELSELSEVEHVKVMRHLRKLAKAQSWVGPKRVPRMRVDVDTGVVKVQLRKVNRRRVLLQGQASGFLVVNDGYAAGRDIARLLGYPPELRQGDVELVA